MVFDMTLFILYVENRIQTKPTNILRKELIFTKFVFYLFFIFITAEIHCIRSIITHMVRTNIDCVNQAWSNGRIYAPVHQEAMRTSAKGVVRYSTGLFSFMKEIVEVPEKFVDDEYQLRFRPFNNMDFLEYVNTEEGKASKYAIESYCGVTTVASIDS
ncbi:hypothetical protein HanRHA438_Chr10g0460911 [Helianthus annuus]|uniref:Uncharacterized protein n=1 Tax=Helianthus annuus TaxID=4232 RepID=A0A9K3N4W2_HELAN|nr:hypothetical protein HanXRQr2_Chr10g0448371 [Helianthus annuus]KAJ0514350.1 hypothetical protein HanHA300_Chr10g0368611 [Helianthus annuus]KAJ0522506.1 hypothetical protein HanIR_Chr10g0483361 [Helianthus annuus]KAJ0697348.1 hypothetical protein HanLR1_Chr10g0367961 [Helianthus annuus]KAJ0880239.1 hypothetical protein HanRHA438_Chr10g0460911 [Helianthus annuus]